METANTSRETWTGQLTGAKASLPHCHDRWSPSTSLNTCGGSVPPGGAAGGDSRWTWNPAQSPVGWVTLAEAPDLPMPQFPHVGGPFPPPQCCCGECGSKSDHIRAQSRTLEIRESTQAPSVTPHARGTTVKATAFPPLLPSPDCGCDGQSWSLKPGS